VKTIPRATDAVAPDAGTEPAVTGQACAEAKIVHEKRPSEIARNGLEMVQKRRAVTVL
jgi:hypothetical protein